jgi:hypothetical protein
VAFKDIASFTDEMRKVERRHRVGTNDHQDIATGNSGQGFAGLKYRQGTAQPAQIEINLRHRPRFLVALPL